MVSNRDFIPIVTPWMGEEEIEAVQRVIASGWIYQGPVVQKFERKFADYVGAKYACAVSSCTTALHLALIVAGVRPGDEVITSHPSFLMYQKFVQIRGGENIVVPLRAMAHDLEAITGLVTEKTRLIFIDNPNNPTATIIPPDALYSFLAAIPEHVVVILDEAYRDFVDQELQVDINRLINDVEGRCGVVSLRTFSKAYGLAGLRVGFGIMHNQIATCLHKVRQPFNINGVALSGALAALEDNAFYQRMLTSTKEPPTMFFPEFRFL